MNHSKLKRKRASTANVPVPPTSPAPDIVDLVDSDEEVSRNGWREEASTTGRSNRKKSKLENVERAAEGSSKIPLQQRNSGETSKNANGSMVHIERMDSEEFFYSASNSNNGNGKNFNHNTEDFLTPSVSPSVFKVPELPQLRPQNSIRPGRSEPPPEVPGPSGVTAPTKSLNQITKIAASVRDHYVATLIDIMDDISNQALDTETIEALLQNVQISLRKWPNIFAVHIFPLEPNSEDETPVSEIEEFTSWSFFGLLALLFASSSVVKPYLGRIKRHFRAICQLILNGHPGALDKFVPQLLGVLRELVCIHSGVWETRNIIIKLISNIPKIKDDEDENTTGGSDNERKRKEHTFKIPISAKSESIIPHFLQAVCVLLPRVHYYHIKDRIVFVELIRRLLYKFSPTSVSTFASCFSICVMPNPWYLTETRVVSMIRRIIEYPGTPNMDVAQVQRLFSLHDMLQHRSTYSGFLEESSMTLLGMYASEKIHSEECVQLLKNGKSDMMLNTLRRLQKRRPGKFHVTETDEEIFLQAVALIRLLHLDVVLHPTVEKVLISELKNAATNRGRSNQPVVLVETVSHLWGKIVECWEFLLNQALDPTLSQIQKLNLLEKTTHMVKFISKVQNSVADVDLKFQFLREELIKNWLDIVQDMFSSFDGLQFNVAQKYQLLSLVYETIGSFEKCTPLYLPLNVLKTLLAIVGWPWLKNYHKFIPSNGINVPNFVLKEINRQFLLKSTALTASALRCLRLNIFRPWQHFVIKIYATTMMLPVEDLNPELISVILDGIAEVNWIMKEIGLKTVFMFLSNILGSDLWTWNSCVRSGLGPALASLPCICCYSMKRISTTSQPNSEYMQSNTGCEKCFGKDKTIELPDLPENYVKKIIQLGYPVLKSTFYLVKLKICEVITRANNHMKLPTASTAFPMMEVALYGRADLCQEIFRKIGEVLVLDKLSDLESVNKPHLDIAQKIFRVAIPSLLNKIEKEIAETDSTITKLPHPLRAKIMSGILELSSVGPMNLAVFIEIMRLMVLILGLSTADDTAIIIYCQKIVTKFGETHKCSPHEMLSRARYEIAQQFVKVAFNVIFTDDMSPGGMPDKFIQFLELIKFAGRFHYNKTFQTYFYPPILEEIIHKLHEDDRYELLLQALAQSYYSDSDSENSESNYEEQKVFYLMQDYVMYYVPKLLLDHPSSVMDESFKYIRENCQLSMLQLVQQQEQRILNETLCRFNGSYEELIQLIARMCKWEELSPFISSQPVTSSGKKSQTSRTSRRDLLDLLDKRFLGFIIHFDTKMGSKIETLECKKRIIKSFALLIKLMDKPTMLQFRNKVYKTLISTADVSPALHEDLYNTWKEFANSLEDGDLAQMTSQIVVALLPLRENPTLRIKVDGLISHLVCFKKSVTESHHKELYFLLGMKNKCEDPRVELEIKNTFVEMKAKKWLDYFNLLMEEAKHDNFFIRYQAFKTLREVLTFEFSNVEKDVLSKGETIVSQVITTLLEGLRLGGCQTKDQRQMQLVIADCFGLLGALDPVKFQIGNMCNTHRKIKGGILSCQVNKFCAIYLQELTREFQEAKDTTSFDYCACLIGIVVKVMNITDSEKDPIWQYLAPEQRDSISPLLKREDYKRYTADERTNLPAYPEIIYLSEHGRTFDSWLTNWITVLISYMTDAHKEVRQIFSKSLVIIRRNLRLANFIAPYVTTYAIFCGSATQRRAIVNEMMTVLERWTVLEDRKTLSTQPQRDIQTEEGEGVIKESGVEMSLETETVFHSRCTQVVLGVLDHLLMIHDYAKRVWGLKKAKDEEDRFKAKKSSANSQQLPMDEDDMCAIEHVLNSVPKMLISQVAFDYEAYAAALYYFERELKSPSQVNATNVLQENIDYLQRIYVALDDMDSVVGLSTIREREPVDHERVLECIGNLEMEKSVKILEHMSEKDPESSTLRNALIQAYINMEETYVADTFIKATLGDRPEWEVSFQEVQSEAFLKLQKWDELKNFADQIEISSDGSPYLKEKIFSWKLAVPRVLSKMHQNDFDKAIEIISDFKMNVLAPLVAACDDLYPYKRAYNYIVQLHIVAEIEDVIKLLRRGENVAFQSNMGSDIQGLISKWNTRLANVSKSKKVVNEILKIRMSCFEILKQTAFGQDENISSFLNEYIRDCWLEMARDASKVGNFILSDNCLTKVKEEFSFKVLIEEAKVCSRKGNKVKAVQILDKAINEYYPVTVRNDLKQRSSGSMSQATASSKTLCAKALLLETKLREELKQLDNQEYAAKYRETTEVDKRSEKNLFTFGSYYDRQWSSANNKEDQSWWKIQEMIVKCYSFSLFFGCKYVYQSLPRLLSIWFDFTAKDCSKSKEESNSGTSVSSSMTVMNTAIETMKGRVPAYILMTAFSQLISRLCHNNAKTWSILRSILANLIQQHPHQTIWMTIAIYKSVNPSRKKRCTEIYKSAKENDKRIDHILNDYISFTDKLITFIDKKVPDDMIKQGKVSLVRLYPDLQKFLKLIKNEKREILVPFQAFLTPTLPQKSFSQNVEGYNPFPDTQVYISGIESEMTVMTSLVRPKKITLQGSDGKTYSLLCKPQDDLRKDSKVMEVNSVVNWYLSQNTESSQRRLHVRTYAVTPLNETHGLLEWVQNLTTIRAILTNLYKEKNLLATHRTQRNRMHQSLNVDQKKQMFLQFLDECPPVLSEWFCNNFGDHQSWYAARLAFTRSAAVMSMVGYVMGLGDRHNENILIDCVTGAVVHVDFNCIFNKGEDFAWPEKVPFRLTHNFVDGMGPLGVENGFRKCCEIVMKTFRERQTIFLSVLRPFVFDPLVEWDKDDRKRSSSSSRGSIANLATGESYSQKAVETMNYIRNRIIGTGRATKTAVDSELSVEAMVQYLIKEASSLENLCQMFPGWAPQY